MTNPQRWGVSGTDYRYEEEPDGDWVRYQDIKHLLTPAEPGACRHPVLVDSTEQPGKDIYVCARCDTQVWIYESTHKPPERTTGSP